MNDMTLYRILQNPYPNEGIYSPEQLIDIIAVRCKMKLKLMRFCVFKNSNYNYSVEFYVWLGREIQSIFNISEEDASIIYETIDNFYNVESDVLLFALEALVSIPKEDIHNIKTSMETSLIESPLDTEEFRYLVDKMEYIKMKNQTAKIGISDIMDKESIIQNLVDIYFYVLYKVMIDELISRYMVGEQ